MFRLVITGSHRITEYFDLLEAIGDLQLDPNKVSSVMIGSSKGVDSLARKWAHKNHISVRYIFANFKNHGKTAMAVRNRVLSNQGDVLLALWDGICPHTQDLIKAFRDRKKPYYIHMVACELHRE